MAKIRKIYDETIKPNGEKTVIYPITSTRAVYTPSSVTIDSLLNEGYRFGGVALPTDSPSITDQRVFYGASVPGTYTNFGGINVDGGEAIFLMWDGTEWHKGIFGGAGSSNLTGFKSLTYISELPLEPTMIGYLIGDYMYVWVGENGDTLQGKYQNVGQLRGASAYEVAVRNGYEGTEQQWLNDPIHGIKGVSVASVAEVGPHSDANSAENTYRITLSNNEKLDMKVKNGKGINSVTVVGNYSSLEGAVNTYRITLSDNTVFEFQVKNGSQGNTGSSINYPFELLNVLNSTATDKGVTALKVKELNESATHIGTTLNSTDTDIKHISDFEGTPINPVTHQRGVLDDDGSSLEPKIQHSQDIDAALTSEVAYTSEQINGMTRYNYYITLDTGKYNSVAGNKHVRIVVNPGDGVTVTANSTYNAHIAFLRSNNEPVALETPDYAEGWTAVANIRVGTTKHFIAPRDARILYVNALSGEVADARIPASLIIHRVNAPTYDEPLMKVTVAGKGDTLTASKRLYGFIPGRTYRMHVVDWPWASVTESSQSRDLLSVYSMDAASSSSIVMRVGCDAENLAEFYDFTIPEGSETIVVNGRLNDGATGKVLMEDITEVASLGEKTLAYSSVTLEPSVIANNTMFTASGNIVTSLANDLYKYTVTPGNAYLFSGRRLTSTSGGNIYLIAWYDSNEVFIDKEPFHSTSSTGVTLNEERLIAPAGAAYAFVNVYKAKADSYVLKRITTEILGQVTAERAEYTIGYLGNPDFKQTKAMPTVVPDKYILAENGDIATSSTGAKYAELSVSGYSMVRFLGIEAIEGEITSGYAFYDGENNVIASYSWPASNTYKTREIFASVPDNAVTFRTSFNIGITSSSKILAAEEDFYIYRCTGLSLEEKLIRADEAISRPLAEHSLTGKGNTYVSKQISTLLPGHKYRMYIKTWNSSDVTSTASKLWVGSYNGAAWTEIIYITVSEALAPYYTFTVPMDSVSVSIGGRLNNGVVGKIDLSDISAANTIDTVHNTIRVKRAATSSAMGLMPLSVLQDSNGWELPQTLQQLVTVKKAKQFCNIKWTPKYTLPGKRFVDGHGQYMANAHPAGVEQTGIPYSGNWSDLKYVGIEVSLHTFMTAVNNPYSLLYTENINKSHTKSAWGRTYYNTNGWMYYGTVCCGLSSSANGQPTKYGNEMIEKVGKSFGVFMPIEPQDLNLLRIGDIANYYHDGGGHSWVVTSLHRTNGVIDTIQYAESTGVINSCRFYTRTAEEFPDYLKRNEYTLYRVADLYKNTRYEPSPYVPLTEYGETAPEVTYNNDICCFAGDKATFMVGDRVAVNYNLVDPPRRLWTQIEVWKDDELLNTYTISAINQEALDESQQNHALDLGTTLAPGKYKARLTDGGNYSDYTYWEVLPNNVTITYRGDGGYRIAVSGEHKMRYVYCGFLRDTGYFAIRAGREPDFYEIENNVMILYFDDLIKEWNMARCHHIRVMIQGDYGMAATPAIALPGRSGEEEESDDDDPVE